MIQLWLNLALSLVVAAIAVGITCVATQQTQLLARAGFVGAGLVSLMTFGELVCATVRFWVGLETSLGAVRRLKDFAEAVGPKDAPDDDSIQPPQEWPAAGVIRINGISASYTDDNGPGERNLALKQISMSIEAGEKVAVI